MGGSAADAAADPTALIQEMNEIQKNIDKLQKNIDKLQKNIDELQEKLADKKKVLEKLPGPKPLTRIDETGYANGSRLAPASANGTRLAPASANGLGNTVSTYQLYVSNPADETEEGPLPLSLFN